VSFEDEWNALKGEVRQQGPVSTRLNGLPPGEGGGGSSPELLVVHDDLGRVGHEAFVLHGRLVKDGDIGEASFSASTSLVGHGFVFGTELGTAAEFWNSKLKTLLQACAHISNHLDYSSKSQMKEDVEIAASLGRRDGTALPVSKINELIK
jgi:hypothetical protein